MAGRTKRNEQVSATREALLAAAERLFAEQGVHAVANRQISEAAGQGNNAAVTYHFGTKSDLIGAIVRKHGERIEGARVRMLAELDDSPGLQDSIAAAVYPVVEHLETLGSPSWYARFVAQIAADPALRVIAAKVFYAASPSLQALREGLDRCLPELPPGVHDERAAMTRHLITQMCAERERALAEGAPTPRATWGEVAAGLVDVIVAIWQAPVTPRG
ncbi:TetR/AcrR family transcriptional regulator [Streptomyces sp. NPDC090075]|uniref:TetR/AcrR family transcriptional regulator n=1 Tax=Streptomyces sp. NPDC090075 TaxID=3365937 RepID=UPI0037FB31FB